MTEWRKVAAEDGLEVWRGPGTGPALVAVHGLEDSWRTWRQLAARLPDHVVYALHMPWHTGNDYGWRGVDTLSGWLRRALALVPARATALLGHSFGANTILDYLADTDEHEIAAQAAVLFAPFYRPPGYVVTPHIRRRSWAAFRKVILDGLGHTLEQQNRSLPPDLRVTVAAKLLERAVPAGFPAFLDEFHASGDRDLGRITVPTLVLAGQRDEGLTPARTAALSEALLSGTVRLRAAYGHFCHLAQADSASVETAEFLRSHSQRGGEHAVTTLLDGEPTSYVGMPRYEGANIRTWIGFKHFMYLAEEAVHQYFRERGVGARTLYHEYGLGLEIVDSSVQLPVALEVDEQVYATVTSAEPRPGQGAPFTVHMVVERANAPVTVLKGKVRVALVSVGKSPVPEFLAPYVVPSVATLSNKEALSLPVEPGEAVEDVLPPGGMSWQWRAPYHYCHFSDRLQHSAYVRTLEEAVDRYLHGTGLGIGKLLTERGWIPVVSKARVQMLDDVSMEETVHTVFAVEDIFRDVMYSARMDCYVRRGDRVVRTATASIMHGYANAHGSAAGTVATLDLTTKRTLLGGVR